MLIAYHYDANAIRGIALPNRQAATITKAWQQIQDEFTVSGASPNTWVLDNETSHKFQAALTKNK